jgi:hypothetical protein
MISGPARFPKAQAEKRSNAYGKALDDFVRWDKKVQRAMVKTLRPEVGPISADDPQAIQALNAKITEAEALQVRMKQANRIIRQKDLTDAERVTQLVDQMDFVQSKAIQLVAGDQLGRRGYADYALKNNNANIRRMKARIEEIQTTRGAPAAAAEFEGGRVEENAENNRLQIFFDDKPDADMRKALKSAGFHWAPKQEGRPWQRQRGRAATLAAERILKVSLEPIEAPVEPSAEVPEPMIFEAPTEPPAAAPPKPKRAPADLTKLSQEQVVERAGKAYQQLQRESYRAGEGVQPWTRFDPNIQDQRSGTIITRDARSALGRAVQAEKRLAAAEADLRARGLTDDEIADLTEKWEEETTEREGLRIETEGGVVTEPTAEETPFAKADQPFFDAQPREVRQGELLPPADRAQAAAEARELLRVLDRRLATAKGKRRQAIAQQMLELYPLAQEGEAISPEELRVRAIAGEGAPETLKGQEEMFAESRRPQAREITTVVQDDFESRAASEPLKGRLGPAQPAGESRPQVGQIANEPPELARLHAHSARKNFSTAPHAAVQNYLTLLRETVDRRAPHLGNLVDRAAAAFVAGHTNEMVLASEEALSRLHVSLWKAHPQLEGDTNAEPGEDVTSLDAGVVGESRRPQAEAPTLGAVAFDRVEVVAPNVKMPGLAYGAELFELARELEAPARYKALETQFGRFRTKPTDRLELDDIEHLPTLAHELGHVTDWRLQGNRFPPSIKKRFGRHVPRGITEHALREELAQASQAMRPVAGGPARFDAYRRRHSELMADYHALYVLDTPLAKDLAPNVTEAFESLLKTKPQVRDLFVRLLAARAEIEPDIDMREISPEPSPRSLIPDNIEGDYTDAVKALIKGVPRTFKLMKFEAGRNAERWRKRLSEEELEDVGAAVEGIGNLRTGKSAADVQRGLTQTQRDVLKEYRFQQERARQSLNKFMQDVRGDDYVKYLEDYLFHFYAGGTKRIRPFASRWARKVPSALQRRLPTLQDAVEAGLTPISQNVAQLHQLWAEMNWRGAINQRFVHDLSKMMNADGQRVIQKPKDAPPDWPIVDHPAIRRVYAKLLPSGALELWHGGAAVDPDIYKYTRQVFEQPFRAGTVRAVELVNAFAKTAALSFSLFHHWALTESAQGALARFWNPVRGIFMIERGLKSGIALGFGRSITQPHREGLKLMENPDFVRDLTMHGVNIDPIPDLMVHRVNRALREWEVRSRKVPGLRLLATAARRFKEGWDHVLWNRYYTGLKGVAYWDLVKENLARMPDDVTPAQIRTMKEKIGELVNDMFGGQEWEGKFWLTPRGRQVAHWVFLAPDWTLSNINVAGKTFAQAGDATTRRVLPRYWRNMIASFIALIAAANYAQNKRWPWENEPGHKLDIDVTDFMRRMPWISEKERTGKRRWYIRPGKQFREVLRYVNSPIDILGAKTSPVVKTVFEQVTGHQPGQSGWPMPWAWEELSWYESLGPRVGSMLDKFKPFAFRGNNFAFTFPMSRGMSWYKAQKAYEDIIRAQVDPSLYQRLMPRRAAETLKAEIDAAAELNGLDPASLYKQANSKVRSTYYSQMWRAIEADNMEDAEKAATILLELGATGRTTESSGTRRGFSPQDVGRGLEAARAAARRKGRQP